MSESRQSLPSQRRLRQYQMAEKLARIGHWHWSVGDDAVDWSPEIHHLFGITADHFEGSYEQTLSMLSEDTRTKLQTLIRQCVVDGEDFQMEIDYDHPDGTVHHFQLVGEHEVGPDGRTIGILGVMKDLTDIRRMSRDLKLANDRQRHFVEMSSDWMWEMGPDLRFTYFSRQFSEALGIPVDDVIGQTRRELHGDDELPLEMEMHLAWLEQRQAFRDFRYWVTALDGSRKCVSSTGTPIYDPDGTFAGYRGFARDVTDEELRHAEFQKANREMKAANHEKSSALNSLQQANVLLEEQAETLIRVQNEIRHAALHDPLTKIANRRYLDERMTELAKQCQENGNWLAVLHIDLDRFKQINDTAGHAAGDALLVHVAEILKKNTRGDDFVARIGGDEFVIVCVGGGHHASAGVRSANGSSRPRPSHSSSKAGNAGSAQASGSRMRAGAISFRNSCWSTRTSRSIGRKALAAGGSSIFPGELQAEIIHTQQISDGIRVGLNRREFIPHYQAQIDANDPGNQQASRRWHAGTTRRRACCSPTVFLEIAHELNAVSAIDRDDP